MADNRGNVDRWVQWVFGLIITIIVSLSIYGFALRENVARHDEKIKTIEERSNDNKESIKSIVEDYRKSISEIKDTMQKMSSKMSVVLYRIDDLSPQKRDKTND